MSLNVTYTGANGQLVQVSGYPYPVSAGTTITVSDQLGAQLLGQPGGGWLPADSEAAAYVPPTPPVIRDVALVNGVLYEMSGGFPYQPISPGKVIDVPVPTGIAVFDTTALQALLDLAAANGGGVVRLAAGYTYTINGVSIDTGVKFDLNSSILKLADGANTYLLCTKDYATLAGTDTTNGPRDFEIVNGYLDGNKSNNTATDKPTLAIYGRRYRVFNLLIRNGKGTGYRSEWATSSPFLSPNGFESFVHQVYIHSCDGDGIDWNGPHDTFIGSIFLVKNGASANSCPARFADETGRSNGTNVQQVHIYGGNGYNFGLIAFTAGMRFNNIISEGAQVAQVKIGTQVKIDGGHLYTGGIATASAVGIQFGDASHTGVNGVSVRNVDVENCGGGGFDPTYLGDNNVIDLNVSYFSGTTPSNTNLGFVGSTLGTNQGARNDIRLRVSNNSFVPTIHSLKQQVGPLKIFKVSSSDTRDPVSILDETGSALSAIDRWGRYVAKGGGTPAPSAGAQQGSGGTAGTVAGFDIAGTVSLTTGSATGLAAGGQLQSVTFAHQFGNAPAVVVWGLDAASQALLPYATVSATNFSIRTANVPTAATAYQFGYMVIGKTS